MTETPQTTIEYAKKSAVSGMSFLDHRRVLLVNGQEVGRLDRCPSGHCAKGCGLWVVLYGGRVPEWEKYSEFLTRESAEAYVEMYADGLLRMSR